MREPGAGIGRDISGGEAVEHELDAFISRRHEQRVAEEGERPEHEIWRESEMRYDAFKRAEDRAARLAYHEGQAARLRHALGELVAQHEAAADKYRTHRHEGAA
jgi:hypothetical protein